VTIVEFLQAFLWVSAVSCFTYYATNCLYGFYGTIFRRNIKRSWESWKKALP